MWADYMDLTRVQRKAVVMVMHSVQIQVDLKASLRADWTDKQSAESWVELMVQRMVDS